MSPFAGKIIFLNAPPGAGKDTIANHISATYGTEIVSFKKPMFAIASAMVGMTIPEFMIHYDDRQKKEFPCNEFLGMSARSLLIAISEEFCKPKFGNDYFGKVAAASMNIETLNSVGYVFSDCGFVSEVHPIAEKFGNDACRVVQFSGQGSYEFGADSRGWIDMEPHGIITSRLAVTNDGYTIDEYTNYLIEIGLR